MQAPVPQALTFKCRYGQLVVNANTIQLQLGGIHARQSASALRSALMGIDTLPGVAGFLGMGGQPNLRFHFNGGITFTAEWLKKEDATQIKSLLGFL